MDRPAAASEKFFGMRLFFACASPLDQIECPRSAYCIFSTIIKLGLNSGMQRYGDRTAGLTQPPIGTQGPASQPSRRPKLGRWIGCLTTIAIVSLALLMGSPRGALAAQAVLAWYASSDSSVIGYNVYVATQSGDYQTHVNAGNNTSYTVTGLSASQTYDFNVTAYSRNAEGPFTQKLVCDFITAGTASNGQITPAGSTAVGVGGSQTYSIVPNPGYQTGAVTVDGQQVANPTSSYTFSNVSGCHTIAATFVPANYTITATAQAGGTISPSGTVSVTGGTNQPFTISPAANYTISDVQVDGTSVGTVTSYTFSDVTANHSISATFTAATYTISASAGSNGSISPPGATTVTYGNNQSYTITPSSG